MIRNLIIKWLGLDERYQRNPEKTYSCGAANPAFMASLYDDLCRVYKDFDPDPDRERRLELIAKLRGGRRIITDRGVQGSGSLAPDPPMPVVTEAMTDAGQEVGDGMEVYQTPRFWRDVYLKMEEARRSPPSSPFREQSVRPNHT